MRPRAVCRGLGDEGGRTARRRGAAGGSLGGKVKRTSGEENRCRGRDDGNGRDRRGGVVSVGVRRDRQRVEDEIPGRGRDLQGEVVVRLDPRARLVGSARASQGGTARRAFPAAAAQPRRRDAGGHSQSQQARSQRGEMWRATGHGIGLRVGHPQHRLGYNSRRANDATPTTRDNRGPRMRVTPVVDASDAWCNGAKPQAGAAITLRARASPAGRSRAAAPAAAIRPWACRCGSARARARPDAP